jgi:hypothetical protein
MEDLGHIGDDELLRVIERMAVEESTRMTAFLAYLGEADRRGVPVKAGYSSTFDYCVRRLKLSESETYRRIQAARAAILRPQLLAAMKEGQLSLSAVSLIAPHVRRPDAPEIISHAEGKSTKELENLLAPLVPQFPKRDRIRSVAVVSKSSGTDGAEKPPIVRVEFNFQGSPALRAAINRAKELLSNKFPFGGLEDVLLEIVLDYLSRHEPQTRLDIPSSPPPRGRSKIARSTRRAVWARAGGRCSYSGPDGTLCQTRHFLELDHIVPRALGGDNSENNLRLLCRAHNDAERRRILGEGELSTELSRERSVDKSG